MKESVRIAPKVLLPGSGVKDGYRIRCARSRVTMAGTDKDMSKSTRIEVLEKLRRRYGNAGAEHKRQLLDQAVQLLGYHRKAAILPFSLLGLDSDNGGEFVKLLGKKGNWPATLQPPPEDKAPLVPLLDKLGVIHLHPYWRN